MMERQMDQAAPLRPLDTVELIGNSKSGGEA